MKQWTEGLDAWRSLARATNAKAVNSFQTPYVGETGDIGEGSGFGRDDSSGAARLPAKVTSSFRPNPQSVNGHRSKKASAIPERLCCVS